MSSPPESPGAPSPAKQKKKPNTDDVLLDLLSKSPPAKIEKSNAVVLRRLPFGAKKEVLMAFQGSDKKPTQSEATVKGRNLWNFYAKIDRDSSPLASRPLLRATLERLDKSVEIKGPRLDWGRALADAARLTLRLARRADTAWLAAAKEDALRTAAGGRPAVLRPEFILAEAIRFVLDKVRQRMDEVASSTDLRNLCHCPPLWWDSVVIEEFGPALGSYNSHERLINSAKQLIASFEGAVCGQAKVQVCESAALDVMEKVNDALCALDASPPNQATIAINVNAAITAASGYASSCQLVVEEARSPAETRALTDKQLKMEVFLAKAVAGLPRGQPGDAPQKHRDVLKQLVEVVRAGGEVAGCTNKVLKVVMGVVEARLCGRVVGAGSPGWMVGKWPADKVKELEARIEEEGAAAAAVAGGKGRKGENIGAVALGWYRVARFHEQ